MRFHYFLISSKNAFFGVFIFDIFFDVAQPQK